MPAVRTIFGFFFLMALFDKILEFVKEKGYQQRYSSAILFICLLAFNAFGYLPEPYMIISALGFIFLIPPFQALNYAILNSKDIEFHISSLNGRQIAIVCIGAIIWSLAMFGIFQRTKYLKKNGVSLY